MNNELSGILEEILIESSSDVKFDEDTYGREVPVGMVFNVDGSYLAQLCKLAGFDMGQFLEQVERPNDSAVPEEKLTHFDAM